MSAPVTWTRAAPVRGVFDVAGPRADGRLVVAAGGKLFLLNAQDGAWQRFAGGPQGYPGAGGEEPYIALAPGDPPVACTFARDDLFVLQLKPAGGITRIDAGGLAHQFAEVPGVDSLHGITFDSTGKFGHSVLVAGPHGGRTTIAAVDCHGSVTVITRTAPVLEGGLTVAPSGFGAYGGDLIATDELSGNVYAISPDGSAQVLVRPAFGTGGDIGVEGAGFVPAGPVENLTAYFADRATPGNPHAGSDHLLALTGPQLARAGVRSGDLLVATEGGAGLAGVRCDSSCSWYPVIADNPVSHGEGHVLVTAGSPGAAFGAPPALVRTAASPAPPIAVFAAIAAAVVLFGVVVVVLLVRRRKRSRSTA